jgi:hypothetical protein
MKGTKNNWNILVLLVHQRLLINHPMKLALSVFRERAINAHAIGALIGHRLKMQYLHFLLSS